MNASAYRSLLWELIAVLDTGKFDKLSIDDVRQHARGGTISKFLQNELGSSADLSLLSDSDWKTLDEQVMSMDNATDASRKFGVKNRGIALLMAWALQGMQMTKTG